MTSQSTILVVDDDPDIRKILRLVLEKNGYAVESAASGREAMARLEILRPDLIVLDIMMETDTAGFEVAKKVKTETRLAGTPIIMLTNFLEKVRQEGPQEFLEIMEEEWPAQWLFEKPVDLIKLLDKVRGLVGENKENGPTGRKL